MQTWVGLGFARDDNRDSFTYEQIDYLGYDSYLTSETCQPNPTIVKLEKRTCNIVKKELTVGRLKIMYYYGKFYPLTL